MHPRPVAAAAYDPALGHLRAFVVFLVVVHHAVLAYYPGVSVSERVVGGDMTWLAFPVLDPERWALAPVVAFFNDTFCMALGLGIPFLFSAGLVTPAAYQAAQLKTGGEPGLMPYAQAWSALECWPTRPACFVLQLLVYDLVAALLFPLAPGWVVRIGRLRRMLASARPASSRAWRCSPSRAPRPSPSPGAVPSSSRPAASSTTSSTSPPASRSEPPASGAAWWPATERWPGAGGCGCSPCWAPSSSASSWSPPPSRPQTRAARSWLRSGPWPQLSCAASCAGLLAIFVRFGQSPSAAWRRAADASYGIYLVHNAIVAWCQVALLDLRIHAAAKVGLVIGAAYLLSFAAASLLRRTPLVARVL